MSTGSVLVGGLFASEGNQHHVRKSGYTKLPTVVELLRGEGPGCIEQLPIDPRAMLVEAANEIAGVHR